MSRQAGSRGHIGDLSEIGRDLLVMEISTIESDSITGRKMPWFPHAVIDILARYADWLAEARNLKMGAILASPTPLSSVAFAELASGDTTDADVLVTNGWQTIEQLRRTARLVTDDALMRALDKKPLNHLERGIATRIRRNCDQLKAIVVRFRAVEAWRNHFLTAAATRDIAQAGTDTGADPAWAVFREVDRGLTRTEIARSLETLASVHAHRAVLDSDAAVRLRKIWELGTDQIVVQTIVHIDGDSVTRFQRGIDRRVLEFYLDIHNRGIDTAVKQWQTLFDAFSALIGGVADRLFGRSN